MGWITWLRSGNSGNSGNSPTSTSSSEYVKKTELKSELKSELSLELGDYFKKSEVDTKLKAKQDKIDLSPYVKEENLSTALSGLGYVKNEQLNSNYVTKGELNSGHRPIASDNPS